MMRGAGRAAATADSWPALHARNKGIFYRGVGPNSLSKGRHVAVLGEGLYVTWNEATARAFAGEGGTVIRYRLPHDLVLLSELSQDMGRIKMLMGLNPLDVRAGAMYAAVLRSEARRLGYEGAISSDRFTGLVVFDPDRAEALDPIPKQPRPKRVKRPRRPRTRRLKDLPNRGRAARAARRGMSVGTVRQADYTDDDGQPVWLVRTQASKCPFEFQSRDNALALMGQTIRWPRGSVEPVSNKNLEARPMPDVESRLLWRVYRDGVDTGLRIDFAFYAKWDPGTFGVMLKRGRKRLGHVVGYDHSKHNDDGEWVNVGQVGASHLARSLRGTGLGGLMYRAFAALVDAKHPGEITAIAPTSWSCGTGTSPDARAVWHSLEMAGAEPVLSGRYGSALTGVGRVNR
jgi:hypothetical protein